MFRLPIKTNNSNHAHVHQVAASEEEKGEEIKDEEEEEEKDLANNKER